MLPTTHIAASCLLTVYATDALSGDLPLLLTLTAGSLALHFAMDVIPHGFITTPYTIFKKPLPTIIEIMPGPLILIIAMLLFGNPVHFISACCCGLLPDLCTTLLWNNPHRYEKIVVIKMLHMLHRHMHWFETDHPDGTVTYRFSNRPLIVSETAVVGVILFLLFTYKSTT